MQVSFRPHTNIAIYITIHRQRQNFSRFGRGSREEGAGWVRAGNCFHFVAFVEWFFHFRILTHLARLSIIAFAILYAHCECASSEFFHQTCSFIKIVYLFAYTHARRQTHRYQRTHARTETERDSEANRNPPTNGWPTSPTSPAPLHSYLDSDSDTDCQLFWVLSLCSDLEWEEKERDRRGREGGRESKGKLPGDCFNIPLRAATCNDDDDDDDAAGGPGARYQVRVRYPAPTTHYWCTPGTLFAHFDPNIYSCFAIFLAGLFMAGSYLLPPTWLSMTLMWTCRLRLGNIALPWQQSGAPPPLPTIKIPALKLPAGSCPAITEPFPGICHFKLQLFFWLKSFAMTKATQTQPWLSCQLVGGLWWTVKAHEYEARHGLRCGRFLNSCCRL